MELSNSKILVIEDDPTICTLVTDALLRKGAQVQSATDGSAGLRLFFEWKPDLVLLDIHLPKLSGWEICRQMRLMSDMPIIFMTAADTEQEIVNGLDCGAIDYVTKPFSISILRARIESALRQLRTDEGDDAAKTAVYQDNHLAINLNRRHIFVNQEPVHLTKTEFRMLTYLVRNFGQVLTYHQILDHVWGSGNWESTANVHVLISRLRQKLEPDPQNPRYLQLEYGVGYRFEM